MTTVAQSTTEVNATTPRPENIRSVSVWRRRLMIGIVVAYAAILILAPLTALVSGAFAKGIGASFTALSDPAVFSAFLLTLKIALLTVAVHALFGTALAWVLVRYRFRGHWLLNGVIDLPFAVSPVVVGYMLLLLFGRTGVLAPVLEALKFKGEPLQFRE